MKNDRNIVWHPHSVSKDARCSVKGQKACLVWLTGLPSSGKSTIAHGLEHFLNNKGAHTYVLDGDNIRHGLNKNLGFSKEDREENIRRIGEVAKLFVDAGLLVIAAFISPYKKDRDMVRNLVLPGEFIEAYVKCPVSICKERDPKGLYKKALAGEIQKFTGVSDPYEEPLDPEIELMTDKTNVKECVAKIVTYLELNKIIKTKEMK